MVGGAARDMGKMLMLVVIAGDTAEKAQARDGNMGTSSGFWFERFRLR